MLCCAARVGSLPIARWLLDWGIDVNSTDEKGQTALSCAASCLEPDGAFYVVLMLLARGAEVDSRDALGRTPLMQAAFNGSISAVDDLLHHGADVNATDSLVCLWRCIL